MKGDARKRFLCVFRRGKVSALLFVSGSGIVPPGLEKERGRCCEPGVQPNQFSRSQVAAVSFGAQGSFQPVFPIPAPGLGGAGIWPGAGIAPPAWKKSVDVL